MRRGPALQHLNAGQTQLYPKALATRSLPMESRLSTAAAPLESHRYGQTIGNPAVVLIVEDEALIRMNAVQMVEDAGYTALEAANADGAIRTLKRRRDIRVVFTDINMSGSRSGLRLAHAIRRRWPPIHLIVTSGLSIDLHLPLNSLFVRKPYENACVVALLNKLLDLN
jgi:CheY-like chemotaxis protein